MSDTQVAPEIVEKAEEYKKKGNEHFKKSEFEEAIEEYTNAIEKNPENAIYYSNRAQCHIKIENYGYALIDATKAIELNKNFIKGYYRRASANLALNKYSIALKDFKVVLKLRPSDKLAREKVKMCLKQVRREKISKALAVDPPSKSLKLEKYHVPKEFIDNFKHDPKELQDKGITIEFIRDMIQCFRDCKKLPTAYAMVILKKALELFHTLPALYHVNVPSHSKITVCGDTHGQYFDLLNIFELNGEPSADNPYLFNGDFVDRGSFSCEVILTLLAFKCWKPETMHLTRGNHESKSLNRLYGFLGEVKHKFDMDIYELFQEVFNAVPLSIVLNKKVMVLHGGIGFERDDVKLAELEKIDRFCEIPDKGLMTDMLWSDPCPQPGRHPSPRGISRRFGPDVTASFLKNNNLELIVRSHEVKMLGYERLHDNLITVFSAPNYCDQSGNQGAYIIFNGNDMEAQISQFAAVPHPDVKPMKYADSMF